MSLGLYPRGELGKLERYKKAPATVESEKMKLGALRQDTRRWARSAG